MEKILYINGMNCQHCAAVTEKALLSIPGVAGAKVDLEEKIATVKLKGLVGDKALIAAVDEVGFEVFDIR